MNDIWVVLAPYGVAAAVTFFAIHKMFTVSNKYVDESNVRHAKDVDKFLNREQYLVKLVNDLNARNTVLTQDLKDMTAERDEYKERTDRLEQIIFDKGHCVKSFEISEFSEDGNDLKFGDDEDDN